MQTDLNNLVVSCDINDFPLNFNKSKKMCSPVHLCIPLLIKNNSLKQVLNFLDLGVTMDHKFDFSIHIDTMVFKTKGGLSFVKRWSKEFRDPYIT